MKVKLFIVIVAIVDISTRVFFPFVRFVVVVIAVVDRFLMKCEKSMFPYDKKVTNNFPFYFSVADCSFTVHAQNMPFRFPFRLVLIISLSFFFLSTSIPQSNWFINIMWGKLVPNKKQCWNTRNHFHPKNFHIRHSGTRNEGQVDEEDEMEYLKNSMIQFIERENRRDPKRRRKREKEMSIFSMFGSCHESIRRHHREKCQRQMKIRWKYAQLCCRCDLISVFFFCRSPSVRLSIKPVGLVFESI